MLFVGIFSNPVESADEVRTFAQRSGLVFPVYRDPTGTVARQLGARVTPELFLIDRGGRLAFHGGLQDDAARAAYEAAVSSLLHKQPVTVATHATEGTPLGQAGTPRDRRPLRHDFFFGRTGLRAHPARAASLCDDLRGGKSRSLVPVVRRQLRVGR